MTTLPHFSLWVVFAGLRNGLGRCKGRVAAVLLPMAVACAIAAAQNTTISGTVYDPRGASGLPLPNVLVYASTTAVAAPSPGVQCLTIQAPGGNNVVAYTYTAADGTFTLTGIPENDSYTVVIQAGKWQRQFSEAVGAGPLTGLALNMPANHTQGNIPMIAIVTGRVDGVECVLRDMGIADTEFTDDTQTTNPGGYIHLYQGDGGPGAEISSSTPLESTLTSNSTLMSGYDMVMFACQGDQFLQVSAPLSNILNYANAGGRLFTTHYSYVYIDPNPPMDAQFAPVANWTTTEEQAIPAGVGTVRTNFSDGATLAQWLENSGAIVAGTPNQIDMSTLRTDVSGVIAPTQSWVTLNNGTYSGVTVSESPVMQMTFNAPVAAPAASQCGRVMYNDYHVIDVNVSAGTVFPSECPAETAMSAQEKMLEYALFDLSTFVQPVVVPTLSATFHPSPLVLKSGDAADQVTVNVTNTSATTEIDSATVLSFTPLPPQVTMTAMTDATGGWICTASTASCTRITGLGAGVTDPVTLTLSVAAYTTLPSYTGTLTATISSATFSTNPSFTDKIIYQQVPPMTWATPAPIVYGTPLSATQLDASSTVAGSFSYSPAAGTVLTAGQHTLTATFTPNDTVDYTTGTATVTLSVVPASPPITLTTSANPVFMTYPVSFTASLPAYASSDTGTVTFYDGTSQIGTASMSRGSATLTTSALPAGSQSITAVYSGDANYGSGTSNAVAENIQDFTLTFSGGVSSVNVAAGGQAVYTLVIAPLDGATLPAGVGLSAAGIPLGATVQFSLLTVSANSAATNVELELNMPGNGANEKLNGPFGGGLFPVALGLVLLPFSRRMRKLRSRLSRLSRLAVLLAALAALAAGLTNCGSNFTSQSFSFTVTAASGSLSHSVTAQVVVK